MREALLLLVCVCAACGGNFSNGDLEFLNALPVREELASKLPGGEAGAQGVGQRVDRLEVPVPGEPSQLYQETRRSSEEFNAGVYGLLTLLESIRQVPPTQRGPDWRLWGPWLDRAHPGSEVRFAMQREGERFNYGLQLRPARAGEEAWWTLLAGSFQAGGGLRKGEGQLMLDLAAAKARGLEVAGLAHLERLYIGYQTRELPLRVEVLFLPAEGQSTSEVRYAYRELPGGLGEMGFLVADTNVVPGSRLEQVRVSSRWTQERGGVGTLSVTGGDVPAGLTSTQVECWDAALRTTYVARSWDGLQVGDVAACPDVSALGE